MSDKSRHEHEQTGRTKGSLEFPPIPTPKRITEDDIDFAVKDIIRKAEDKRDQFSSQAETSLLPNSKALIQSSSAVITERLKKTPLQKARHALRLSAQKTAMTASGLFLIFSSGCGNIESPITPTTITPEPTPTFTPPPSFPISSALSPTSESPKLLEYLAFHNMKVSIDKEGIPIEYILPDGKKVSFDREEVKKLREKAISSKEPEIITMIPIEDSSGSEYIPSPERPRTLELPKDVLSEEELEKRGVKIIQADNTNLFVREGAFGKDALLEDFNNTDRKLTIVLVNGTWINPLYMQDSRYEEFKKFFIRLDGLTADPVKMANDRMEKLALYLRQDLEKFKNEKDVSSFNGKILNLKQNIFVLEEKMVREQFLDHVGSELYLEGKAKGFYKRGENAFIFLAVGGIKYNRRFATIYFDHEGSVAVDTNWEFGTYYSGGGFDPKARETHPNPEDIPKTIASPANPNPGLYHHLTAGFALRHESSHDLLTQQKINKGGEPNWSEYDTDVKAMEGIIKAWEKWETSGFTDNSGYYFVFSLPEGGYILTENKQNKSKTPSST